MITFGDGAPVGVFFGDGTPIAGFFGDGTPITGPPPVGLVEFTTNAATFEPELELSSGSSAVVTWQDGAGAPLATGLAPTISFGSSGTRTVRLHSTNYADIVSINLGFDHTEDSGKEGPGAGYDKAPTGVSGVSGLAALAGLRQFMAADTTLTGPLDLTGLSNLEFVECFFAQITSVTLDGCTSLIRLCLEANHLTTIDLNPVVDNLRDLRIAIQFGGDHTLTFVPLSQPMAQLWHYCTRENAVVNSLPHSQLPVVEQYLTWSSGLTTSDSPISTVLRDYESYNNTLDAASVNRIYIALDTLIPTGIGNVWLDGSASPSGAGATARTNLASRGWDIVH